MAKPDVGPHSPRKGRANGPYGWKLAPPTDEETEFLLAVEDYRHRTGRRFPALTELLGVLRGLGWRKVVEDTVDPGKGAA